MLLDKINELRLNCHKIKPVSISKLPALAQHRGAFDCERKPSEQKGFAVYNLLFA